MIATSAAPNMQLLLPAELADVDRRERPGVGERVLVLGETRSNLAAF
jgi:hypothetical protein